MEKKIPLNFYEIPAKEKPHREWPGVIFPDTKVSLVNNEIFQTEVSVKAMQLIDSIPEVIRFTQPDVERICRYYHFDRLYFYKRFKVFYDLLEDKDCLHGTEIQRIEMLKSRKEQFTGICNEIDQLIEKLQDKKVKLEKSIKEAESNTTYIDKLFSETSLVESIESLPSLESPEGYIYLIREHYKGCYKIGRSINMQGRTNRFDVKLPFDWSIVAIYQVDNMFKTESALHSKFNMKRIQGEWFELDREDLVVFYEFVTNNSREDIISKWENVEKNLQIAEANWVIGENIERKVEYNQHGYSPSNQDGYMCVSKIEDISKETQKMLNQI